MLGFSDDESLEGVRPDMFMPPWAHRTVVRDALPTALRDGSWSGELAFISHEGREIPVSQVYIAHNDEQGNPAYFSAIARDISDQKEFEAKLVHLASHDALTGLYNRRRLEEEVERELAKVRRFGGTAALLFVDLDGFKYVNDTLGHRSGDELLSGVAHLIQAELRETDILARFGGDEFAILLPLTNRAAAETLAEAVNGAVSSFALSAGGHAVRCTASIGIAVAPDHGTTLHELLANADIAMYKAKEARDGFSMFAPKLLSPSTFGAQMIWENQIREALEQEQFVLYAQPIRGLQDGSLQYELLVRMTAEPGLLAYPDQFLPVAERSTLIHRIDRWVVREAIRLIADRAAAGQDMTFEVNLSAKAFSDDHLLPLIRDELASTGADPTRLILEITETAAIADITRAQEFIRELRSLGCKFAIDDFGVGFSSFYYLKHLPVDYLKIDGSFIRNLPNDPADQHLVQSMIQLARGLGKLTVAEFVSDEETATLLRTLGVDFGQGFFLGRPTPVSEVFPPTGTPPIAIAKRGSRDSAA
jgi:diguanylate cyclase (GGDEF)-like protein/PAS domain S-box-containing protein